MDKIGLWMLLVSLTLLLLTAAVLFLVRAVMALALFRQQMATMSDALNQACSADLALPIPPIPPSPPGGLSP